MYLNEKFKEFNKLSLLLTLKKQDKIYYSNFIISLGYNDKLRVINYKLMVFKIFPFLAESRLYSG